MQLTDEQKALIEPLQRMMDSAAWIDAVEWYVVQRTGRLDRVAGEHAQEAGYRLEAAGRRAELLDMMAYLRQWAGYAPESDRGEVMRWVKRPTVQELRKAQSGAAGSTSPLAKTARTQGGRAW